MASMFAEVALTLPIHQTFTYSIPSDFEASLQVGQRVLVPFGPRRLTGHVVSVTHEQPKATGGKGLKSVLDVLDPEPIFRPELLEFFQWIASYYQSPLGEVLKCATPSGIDLKSLRQVSLTPEGLALVDRTHVESTQDRLFLKLADDGPTAVSNLLKLGGVKEALLKRLERSGLIRIDTALAKVRVKIRKEKFVSLTSLEKAGAAKLRGVKQRQVMDVLRESGAISVSQLEQQIKGARGVIERLAKLGLMAVEERDGYRSPFADLSHSEALKGPENLTDSQQDALHHIQDGLAAERADIFLLHGVTGSGKTEVYVRAVESALARGKQAIVLVPEISLTPQTVGRFRGRVGERLAVLHSALSDGERYDEWRRIIKGEVQVVIGARSAIFAPLANLGLVILDEEHESAFKQESGLLYHARDVAIMRARLAKAVVVLGSATPSVETYQKAKEGKFRLLNLPERVGTRPMPKVELVNMNKAPLVYRMPGRDGMASKQPMLSKALFDAMNECLNAREQMVLLLNRRGYIPHISCRGCGETTRCPHCAISLTYYQQGRVLRCHYCDFARPMSSACEACGSEMFEALGFGTESLEEEIACHFPTARIARMDRDTTSRKGSHHQILERVRQGEADILLGTQMVAKGHDFPEVTLVGVVNADLALHMPDFRASERTFQLLTQVAGRAGRGEKPGRVIIQTQSPDHYSVTCAQTHDFKAFFEQEIELRQALHYPPFSRLVCLRLNAESEALAHKALERLRRFAQKLRESSEEYKALEVLGPAAAPLSRLRGQFRWQMLVKADKAQVLHRYVTHLKSALDAAPEAKILRLQIDVDPLNLL